MFIQNKQNLPFWILFSIVSSRARILEQLYKTNDDDLKKLAASDTSAVAAAARLLRVMSLDILQLSMSKTIEKRDRLRMFFSAASNEYACSLCSADSRNNVFLSVYNPKASGAAEAGFVDAHPTQMYLNSVVVVVVCPGRCESSSRQRKIKSSFCLAKNSPVEHKTITRRFAPAAVVLDERNSCRHIRVSTLAAKSDKNDTRFKSNMPTSTFSSKSNYLTPCGVFQVDVVTHQLQIGHNRIEQDALVVDVAWHGVKFGIHVLRCELRRQPFCRVLVDELKL